jgi:hypothetical protein
VAEHARNGWPVDCIVLDYIDLLAPLNGKAETRDQIDLTWRKARGIAQKAHCAFVTASQPDSGAYEVKLLSKKNFSNSKTKLAHPTATFGMNQTASERDRQVMRLNPIAVREGSFGETKCVYVATCLAIADPFRLSAWGI